MWSGPLGLFYRRPLYTTTANPWRSTSDDDPPAKQRHYIFLPGGRSTLIYILVLLCTETLFVLNLNCSMLLLLLLILGPFQLYNENGHQPIHVSHVIFVRQVTCPCESCDLCKTGHVPMWVMWPMYDRSHTLVQGHVTMLTWRSVQACQAHPCRSEYYYYYIGPYIYDLKTELKDFLCILSLRANGFISHFSIFSCMRGRQEWEGILLFSSEVKGHCYNEANSSYIQWKTNDYAASC